MSDDDILTEKERGIVGMMAAGHVLKEIAATNEISINTVRFHQKNIYRKLNVTNRVNAIRVAKSKGLIEPENSMRKRLVRLAYDGFVSGDPAPLLSILHPDVEWICDAPEDVFPHAGRTVGKDLATQRIMLIARDYLPVSFVPRSMVEDGNEVSVLLDVKLVHLDTQSEVMFDVAHFWQFQEDLVVRYAEVFNSGSLMKKMVPPMKGTEN